MEFLSIKTAKQNHPFKNLNSFLAHNKQGQIFLSGIRGSFFAYLAARSSLESARPFLVITPDNDAGEKICRELKFYLAQEKSGKPGRSVLFFPDMETLPYDCVDPNPEKVISRIETLYKLQKFGGSPIVVSPLPALMQHSIPPEYLKNTVISIGTHRNIDRDLLVEKLIAHGYKNVSLVEERGEFSVRGGILDLFPPLCRYPLRIEFFGDNVDSIRRFNPETQRSLSNLENVSILPVSEVILDKQTKKTALDTIDPQQTRTDAPFSLINEFRETLKNNTRFPGISFLSEFFYNEMGTLFDYLSENSAFWIYGISDLSEMIRRVSDSVSQNLSSSREGKKLTGIGSNFYLTSKETENLLAPFPKIWADPLELLHPGQNPLAFSSAGNKELYQHITKNKSRGRPLAKLTQILKDWIENYYTIVLIAHSDTQKRRIQELLNPYGFDMHDYHPSYFPGAGKSKKGALLIATGQIDDGFQSPLDRTVVLTETEIFGEKIFSAKRIEKKSSDPIFQVDDLGIDDFVVHVDYGVGLYKGLQSLNIGESRNDYLLVEYRNGDRLYVPAYRLNLIQKYRGGEERPILNKLGGKAWLRTKNRIKESIKAHAKKLLKTYAARQNLTGYSFSPRDQYYREFEARFEYDETPDQMNAIEDVLADMESSTPMDRLICGDVGYGKTEVALRASFKAVMDNKQVSVLVPTTILAHQHYQTFRLRFHDFPVNIAMLSRFQTLQEQKKIIHSVKKGEFDILIGTHRILQKDIGFKDLGLVIIDEEHRFGVKHKEKLKALRLLVDILTLTATPIPRTLQLSLLNIHNLSIITSPPEQRLPVKTHISHFDEKIIREAIIREFMRDGQVFFVHNRVEKIEALATFLRKIVPEARLEIAHGQMSEKKLEKVMWSFYKREINLLLCTSIIESGLDFPNANTMIINRADRMGLAQLYQLRGRVGRSNHQAFAYFLVPNEQLLTKKAKQRLEVISQFSELGSGFRLANYDLKIRGGGNILGLSQSGNMAQVGIELYYQLIEKAITEIKEEKTTPEVDPEIRLQIPAYIPEAYIPDIHQRLSFYKKMSGGMEESRIGDMENELRDRFGDLPSETKNLLLLSGLKPVLKKYLITTLDCKNNNIILTFHPEADSSLEKILNLIQDEQNNLTFSPDYKLYIPFEESKNWTKLSEKVKKILQ